MRVVLVVKPEDPAREEAERVRKALAQHGARAERVPGPAEAKDADLLVVVGDSAFLLSVSKEVPPHVPVLGVGSAGFGALTEVTVEGFEAAARRIVRGDYWVEAVDRMACRVGPAGRISESGPREPGKPRAIALALNEAALVSAASGQFVRYSLWVDDELVWRDRGDGVIVATPTGSTAYALSAGGPIVLAKTPVFSVVPVCSSDSHQPFVVNEEAAITLADATAGEGVDLVIDGRDRVRVGRGEVVTISRAEEPLRFARLGEKRYTRMLGRLKTQRDVGLALGDAPPSAKFVVKILEYEGPLTQQELVRESNLSARTVRNAVAYLVEHGILEKEPSLRDARQDVYTLRGSGGKA